MSSRRFESMNCGGAQALLAVDEHGEPIDPSKLEWIRGPGMPAGESNEAPSSGDESD